MNHIAKVERLINFFKLNQPRPLFHLFSCFQSIFTTNIYEKCPSSIQCRDSNSRPLEHESPPVTTRPELLPSFNYLYHHIFRGPFDSISYNLRFSKILFLFKCSFSCFELKFLYNNDWALKSSFKDFLKIAIWLLLLTFPILKDYI